MISSLGLVSEPVTTPRSVDRLSLNIFWPLRRSTHVPSKSELCGAAHILTAKSKIAPRPRWKLNSAPIQSDYVKNAHRRLLRQNDGLVRSTARKNPRKSTLFKKC